MAWWIKRTLMKNTICNSDVEEQCWLYLVTASGCDHGQNGNGSSYHFYAKDVAFFSFYAAVSCVFRLYRLCLSTCPEGVLLQPWSKGLLSSLFLFYFILFMYIYFWFPIKVSTVKDNPIASFPSTKLYLDVGRLLVSSFFFTSPRLSSYFLYFIKMSFHHINESQKKNGSSP